MILSVNVHPQEDQFVLPNFRGNRFGFVPLRGNEDFAARDWDAHGFPTNFLINSQGRVVYKLGPVYDDDHEAGLEMQIRTLLSR